MSYTPKSSFISALATAFVAGVTKWAGTVEKTLFQNLADSLQWIDQLSTITFASSFTYDCSVSSLQKITLTANATMSITNAVAGCYYTLEVYQDSTGGRTLTLPGPKKDNGGALNAAANGCTLITFMYDGSYFFFSIGAYS